MYIIDFIKEKLGFKTELKEFPKTYEWMLNDDLTPNWKNLKKCKAFNDLIGCKQSWLWHKEGDVWNHTKKVAEFMHEKINRMNLINTQRGAILMIAALCHDLGKPSTTYLDEKDNDWHCKDHGAKGEKITRDLLLDVPINIREEICWLVRNHMVFHYWSHKDPIKQEDIIYRLSKGLSSIKNLALLNMADTEGSISDERVDITKRYNDIEFVSGCLFDNFSPDEENRDDYPTAYFVIGLPGAGKDTYIKQHLSNLPCICRDDIREELTYGEVRGNKLYLSKQGENRVTEIVNERIETACKQSRNIVINQTSLVKKYRESLVNLIYDSNPLYQIVFIYFEPKGGVKTCIERRKNEIKPDVIQSMWDRMEMPDYTECDKMIFYRT